MGRPIEENATYFPHDFDMRNDPRVKALRRKYGRDGYAIYNMTLEVLTDSRGFVTRMDQAGVEIVAGDFEIEPEKLLEVWLFCISLGLFQTDADRLLLWADRHHERMAPLIARRKRDRQRQQEYRSHKRHLTSSTDNSVTTTDVARDNEVVTVTSCALSSCHNGEKSKVDQSKVKERENAHAAAASEAAPRASLLEALVELRLINRHVSVQPNDEPAFAAILAEHPLEEILSAYRLYCRKKPGGQMHWFLVDFTDYLAQLEMKALGPAQQSLEDRRAERDREEAEHPELVAEAETKAAELKAKMKARSLPDDDWEATAPRGEAAVGSS